MGFNYCQPSVVSLIYCISFPKFSYVKSIMHTHAPIIAALEPVLFALPCSRWTRYFIFNGEMLLRENVGYWSSRLLIHFPLPWTACQHFSHAIEELIKQIFIDNWVEEATVAVVWCVSYHKECLFCYLQPVRLQYVWVQLQPASVLHRTAAAGFQHLGVAGLVI